jgi:hypothetical protein
LGKLGQLSFWQDGSGQLRSTSGNPSASESLPQILPFPAYPGLQTQILPVESGEAFESQAIKSGRRRLLEQE